MSAVRTLPVGKLPMRPPPAPRGAEASIAGVVESFLREAAGRDPAGRDAEHGDGGAESEPGLVTGVHTVAVRLDAVGWELASEGVAPRASVDADLATMDEPELDGFDLLPLASGRAIVEVASFVPRSATGASPRPAPDVASLGRATTDDASERAPVGGPRVDDTRDDPSSERSASPAEAPTVDAVLALLVPLASVRLPPPATRPEHAALARLVSGATRAKTDAASPVEPPLASDFPTIRPGARVRSLADVALSSAERDDVSGRGVSGRDATGSVSSARTEGAIRSATDLRPSATRAAEPPASTMRPLAVPTPTASRPPVVEQAVGLQRLRRALEGDRSAAPAPDPTARSVPASPVSGKGASRSAELARDATPSGVGLGTAAGPATDAGLASRAGFPGSADLASASPASPSAPVGTVIDVSTAAITGAAPAATAPGEPRIDDARSLATDVGANDDDGLGRARRRGGGEPGEERSSSDRDRGASSGDAHTREVARSENGLVSEASAPAFEPRAMVELHPRMRATEPSPPPRAPLDHGALASLPPEPRLPPAHTFASGTLSPEASTRLEVQHPTLGTLTLELASEGDGVGVEVGVRSLDAAIALHASEGRLRAELEGAGTDLRSFRVRTRRGRPGADENDAAAWQPAPRDVARGR